MSFRTGGRRWISLTVLVALTGFQATSLAAGGPPASAGHALVYHDGLKAVLLVNAGLGGATSPPPTTRTTIWKWTRASWVVVDASGPPIRNLGGVSYDSKRDKLVMYGGSYDQEHVYDDTWEWSRQGGWNRMSASGPGKRDHTAMAYDPASGRVVLFGGYDPKSGGRGDTWAWSGTAWSVAAPPIQPRSHACLAATARGVVLLGGFPARRSPTLPLLASDVWKPEDQPSNPGARYLTAAAYDPIRKVTVLFGGGGPPDDLPRADTWEFDASAGWRQIR